MGRIIVALSAVLAVLNVAPAAAQAAAPGAHINSHTAFIGFNGEAWTNNNDPMFAFSAVSAEPVSGFQCRVTGVDWSACTSPKVWSDLPDGVYTFDVRTVAGDEFGHPASLTFGIDTVGPTYKFTTAPGTWTNTTSATFAYEWSDPHQASGYVVCSLGISGYVACPNPVSYTDLKPTFVQSATFLFYDGLGNSSTAGFTWLIDLEPPNTVLSGDGPTGSTNSTSAAFSWSMERHPDLPSTWQCSFDDGPFTACTSPFARSNLAEGPHTLLVREIDQAGNVDPTPASRTWTVDLTPPDTTISSGPAGTVGATTAEFAFAAVAGAATYECKLDGAATYTACTSPATYTGLAPGAHTFAVRARDEAGNVDSTPATREWEIDTTVLDTAIDSGPSGPTASTAAEFVFAPLTGLATYECKLDEGVFAPCTSPHSLSGLAQGAHTLSVRAKSAAGLLDPSPATRTWTVDTVAPPVSLTAKPEASTTATTASFAFSSTEAGATFECRVGAAAFAACTSPHVLTGLTPASRTFEVRALDALGNRSEPASASWTVVAPDPEPTPTPTETATPTPSASATPTSTPAGPSTSGGPAAPGPVVPVTPVITRPTLSISVASLRLRARDRVTARVRLTGASSKAVRVLLRSGSRRGKPVSVTIAPGATATVRLALTSAMRASLTRTRRLRVTIVAAASDGSVTQSRTATLLLSR